MSIVRDHQALQLQVGAGVPGDPACQLCRGEGTSGKPRTNGTARPCICVRRAMAQVKREAGR